MAVGAHGLQCFLIDFTFFFQMVLATTFPTLFTDFTVLHQVELAAVVTFLHLRLEFDWSKYSFQLYAPPIDPVLDSVLFQVNSASFLVK